MDMTAKAVRDVVICLVVFTGIGFLFGYLVGRDAGERSVIHFLKVDP